MILSLYSLKLEAAPTVVSVSHTTEETENLVMYFTALFLFSNIGSNCCYRAKYLDNDGHVFLYKGKWNLTTSVFQSNQE